MSNYDIRTLLEYQGPSTRVENPEQGWAIILDYKNTDENERAASSLLSSQGITFSIDRPARGWSQPKLRLYIMMPADRLVDATSILAAATAQGVLAQVEGDEGLPGQ
jgi:hypothetical protein